VRFWLGVHRPNWLERPGVPLFISRSVLKGRRKLPRAQVDWALDSGGFTELTKHGAWTIDEETYLEDVHRFDEAGRLRWAAPMDWMCEPHMLERTGLSVREHQQRTVENFIELDRRSIVPIIPVLQGWELDDYLACIDIYADAGVDLQTRELVGIGSVCRRQATSEIAGLVREIASHGISLHGFGVKRAGIATYGEHLASADSMAWSFRARRRPPLPGHTHMNCANCFEFAQRWAAGEVL
jgi:hypothetical protein